MNRLLNLTYFQVLSYWRKTHFLPQVILLGIIGGIFLDPNYAPYEYGYIVLLRNATLILIGLITSFHITNAGYSRRMYVLLGRVSRSHYYLSSLLASTLITMVLLFLFDLYALAVAQLSLGGFFSLSSVVLGGLNTLLVVAAAHLFSVYNLDGRYQLAGFLIISCSALPHWYESLPLSSLGQVIDFFLPPLAANILLQQQRVLGLSGLIGIFYVVLFAWIGMYLFRKRSLTL